MVIPTLRADLLNHGEHGGHGEEKQRQRKREPNTMRSERRPSALSSIGHSQVFPRVTHHHFLRGARALMSEDFYRRRPRTRRESRKHEKRKHESRIVVRPEMLLRFFVLS